MKLSDKGQGKKIQIFLFQYFLHSAVFTDPQKCYFTKVFLLNLQGFTTQSRRRLKPLSLCCFSKTLLLLHRGLQLNTENA